MHHRQGMSVFLMEFCQELTNEFALKLSPCSADSMGDEDRMQASARALPAAAVILS